MMATAGQCPKLMVPRIGRLTSWSCMSSTPAEQPTSAMSDPTDRSMPATRITSVMPTASTPVSEA